MEINAGPARLAVILEVLEMAITAAQVKELRERTGAGMMECKKALVETDGNMDAAAEHLRKSGQAKADKKAGRVAAEGLVLVASDQSTAALVEVNSETDFVAKDENFVQFANSITTIVLNHKPADLDALMGLSYGDGMTVAEARTALVAKVGENVNVRRFTIIESSGSVASYVHGGRIAAVVGYTGGSDDLGRDVAMHVSATNPMCISEKDVPKDALETERRILTEQAQDSGKPADIIERMVEGRVKKYLSEITLLGQAFVKDPDQTVATLLKSGGAEVTAIARYEVGEGIEKKEDNFAEEVMQQIKDAGAS